MSTITIRERSGVADGPNAEVLFDGGDAFEITVTNPFSPEEEKRLEWYFEEHLRFPFTRTVEAQEAARSVETYGEALFNQVFADPEAYARYKGISQNELAIEIVGSPDFHHLHWEALKDPRLPQPLALRAPVVRRNQNPSRANANLQPSPTINILIVTARPRAGRDVAYRTISRPLVEMARQTELPLRVDILRPGTYRALVNHLESVRDKHGVGFYHVIHFDVHGALLSYDAFKSNEQNPQVEALLYRQRYGRPDLEPYEGVKAYLFLEGEEMGQADPVKAGEMVNLLINHQVPIAILNACQSAKQIAVNLLGTAEETSLGSRLMQAGMQMVLAMGYSVTVSAAELMMRHLYEQLFQGKEVPAAIRRARLELFNNKERRVYFNQIIALEDWMLPVVYQNRPARLVTRDFDDDERRDYYEHLAKRYQNPAPPSYGFVGRDLDVLNVERRLLKHNVLLVRGMGGAGKTTLLHHLGEWWQTTNFVGEVFYFGYDERAWNRQQIMDAVAQRLLGQIEYLRSFQPLNLDAQQAFLTQKLRSERHLLILDNLESVTGEHLAIRHMLPAEEQRALRRFLAALAGGKTLVLLGSRSGVDWLVEGEGAAPLQQGHVYDLPGLDPEAASTLAELILARHGATQYRAEDDFRRLLRLLGGYPLALEVVLKNLARQTPKEVLDGLEAGDVKLDSEDARDKTESILKCIHYSHSNLSEEAQDLLSCLAPFTGIFYFGALEVYTQALRQQPPLAHLPFDRWDEVLQEAIGWGLLQRHEAQGFLRLQPIFPYFLRNRLQNAEQAEQRQAIYSAFQQHYTNMGASIAALLQAKEPQKKSTGLAVAELEYENLVTALNLALNAQSSIFYPHYVLSQYLDASQKQQQSLALGEHVLARLEGYSEEKLEGQIGVELAGIVDHIATRQLMLRQFGMAEATYQRALLLWLGNAYFSQEQRAQGAAGIYHRLGIIAQEQRQWAKAESYYQQALSINAEFPDRDEQAGTYHQLGIIAQEQRQWAEAESYYQQALAIYVEFQNRYEQAGTYHQLGIIAQQQRQWAEAESYYQQALAIYVEFQDRYSQAGTYHQLGRVAQEQRQWAEAESYYQQALAIKIEFQNRYEQAGTYHQLGRVAQEQRQWAEAESYYQQALAIKIEFQDRYSQASTYHQLGIIAQEQRQWAEAERYYQQALAIKVEFQDRYEQASTYHQLGRVAEAQQHWAEARNYLLKDFEITLEFNDEHGLGITLRSLTRLWRASGDDTLPAAIATLWNAPEEDVRKVLEQFDDNSASE
jgi:tetratricopeptide (TPR) repeat protein